MKYAASLKYGVAMLVGLSVLANIAMADRPRSPTERRQRPNSGFWENSSASTSSYSNGRSVARNSWPINNQQVVTRGNVLPQSGTVVRQSMPNRVLVQPQVVQPQLVQQPVIRQSVVQHPTAQQPVIQYPVVQNNVVQQPQQPVVRQTTATQVIPGPRATNR